MSANALRHGVLGLALMAGQVAAAPAEDCRNGAVPAAGRVLACDQAIAGAATDLEAAKLLVARASARPLPGEAEAILQDLVEALRLVPEPGAQLMGDILVQRAEARRAEGDLDGALRDVREAKTLIPRDADPSINHALILLDQDNHTNALRQIEQAVRFEPRHARALIVGMYVTRRVGDPEACVEMGETAVEVAPARPETWSFRGTCLADLGRPEAAIADYQTALAIGAESAFLLDSLAIAQMNAGHAEEAVLSARHAVLLDPLSASAQRSLATALVATGEIPKALAGHHRALEGGTPDEHGLTGGLAWSLIEAGRPELALPLFEGWDARHPEPSFDEAFDLDAWGHVLAALGRGPASAEVFLRAAEAGGFRQLAHYEARLREHRFPPLSGAGGFEASLRACFTVRDDCLSASPAEQVLTNASAGSGHEG